MDTSNRDLPEGSARPKKRRRPEYPVERLAYTIQDALRTGAIPTRSKLYECIARGDLVTWTEGRSRMISAESLREYVRRKAREAGGAL